MQVLRLPAGDEQQSLEKFELWLRTMIHESWEIYFEGVPDESGDPNPDQFSEQANLLHEDAASLFEVLVDCCCGIRKVAMQGMWKLPWSA